MHRSVFRFAMGLSFPCPEALDTLLILMCSPERLLEKEDLIRQIWPHAVVEESNLAIQISQIRKALSRLDL